MKLGELENCLKKIKDAELDIELLKRENEKLCMVNNFEIGKLVLTISGVEEELKKGLKKSGEDKIECKLGSVSWQKMPDEWRYQDEILMAWIISLPARFKELFLKFTTTINKADLKKQIMIDNEPLFEKSKIIDLGLETGLYLHDEGRGYLVEGIEVVPQEPKFHYTIKNLKK